MNTNPDELKLAQWLDDELQGEELTAFEASLGNRGEHIAARAEVRRWRAMVAAAVPAAEEVPYPDFFNRRVAHAIRSQRQESPAPVSRPRFSWQSLLMPMAACAGMVLAFWMGTQTQAGPPEVVVAGAPKAIPVDPILYTPQRGVKAEWLASSDAAASVVVLRGVAAIPDSMDFSETASIGSEREIDSTAEARPEGNGELSL